MDTAINQRTRIANMFCKAYERAVLLTPTLENVRIWTECTWMTLAELEDTVYDSYELAETFRKIGDIIKDEFLPMDWHFKSPTYAAEIGAKKTLKCGKSASRC